MELEEAIADAHETRSVRAVRIQERAVAGEGGIQADVEPASKEAVWLCLDRGQPRRSPARPARTTWDG